MFDWKSLFRMSLDFNIWQEVLQTQKLFASDQNYTHLKGLKTTREFLRGEKIIKHEGEYIISTFMPPFLSEAFRSNLLAVQDQSQVYTLQSQSKRTAPISCYMALTSKCTLNCLHCSAKTNSFGKDLTTTQWQQTIQDLQEMGTSILGFTGGEPLLRSDLPELIATADKRSKVIAFTSGYRINTDIALQLKKAGLFALGISLDSHLEQEHDAMRNQHGVFRCALKMMQASAKAGLYTIAQTVIPAHKISRKELFPLFRLAYEHGAHEVKILEPILSGNMLKNNPSNYLYTPKQRQELIDLQHTTNKKSGFPKISTFAYTESDAKYGCGAGTQHTYITSDGELRPCDFVAAPYGNVKEDGIKKLWEHMIAELGNRPGSGCLATAMGKQIQAQNLPLPLAPNEARNLCKTCRADSCKADYKPKYYQAMV
jgi:MoaA/NifB/PqqE/SkfB family radical SAM enzyme